MKKHVIYKISILIVVGSFLTSFHNHNVSSTSKTYHILFVGNSLTYSNNLPELVKKEALKKGHIVQTTMLAKPNYAIVDHWAEGKVQQLINSKKYDFVILQQGPSSQNEGKRMLVDGGKNYSLLCQKNNTTLSYFMVWPSKTYYATYDGVITNYTLAAQKNNAILCPVGKVWKDYFDKTEDYSYYSEDGFHPSLKGSEVAAQIIVKSLLN